MGWRKARFARSRLAPVRLLLLLSGLNRVKRVETKQTSVANYWTVQLTGPGSKRSWTVPAAETSRGRGTAAK